MENLIQNIVTWSQTNLGIGPEFLGDIILTLGAWALVLITRLIMRRLVDHRESELQRRYIINKTLNYGLGFVFFFFTMVIWFGGLTGWTAYLGLVSAGLAIALQDPLVNLAGWIFISVRKPFVVGDRIEIGEHRGDVIDQRLFQFSLVEIGNWVDADQSTGRIIHIPNGWVFKQTTANYTAGFEFIWDEIAVMVTFESDWKKAKGILNEIAVNHSGIKDEDAAKEVQRASRQYMIFFQHLTPIIWTSVADSGVVLTLRYICKPRTRRSTQTAIWEDILSAFGEESAIDFAYPTTRFYNNPSEGKPGAGGPGEI
ncbi:MAG: mechanosensitive ion channel family protein [bacterium]|nr:mechanosensitive ion channel family protein [bacterium]